MRLMRSVALVLLLLVVTALPSFAESWPQRTVRVIVPNAPGSAVDLAARLYSQGLSERWHHPVIVENRPGADGILAATSFAIAHDDHTLMFSFAGLIAINPLIHEKLSYDPARDLVPISSAAVNFLAIAVSERLKVSSLAEFIALARSHPGKFNWAATPGLPQYAFAALQQAAGLDMHEVSYRDFGPALQDFSEGRIHAISSSLTVLLPLVQSGNAKMLVVTTRERSPLMAEVPTAQEAGYPELTFEGVVGFYGWRDIPSDLKDRIAADIRAVATDPAIGERLAASGTIVRAGTPAEFASAIEDQRARVASASRTIDQNK